MLTSQIEHANRKMQKTCMAVLGWTRALAQLTYYSCSYPLKGLRYRENISASVGLPSGRRSFWFTKALRQTCYDVRDVKGVPD